MRLLDCLSYYEKIYIGYGITTYSKNVEDNYSTGMFEYEIHNKLAENNVELTIANREKIEREIKKYQGRSKSDWWHVIYRKLFRTFRKNLS